jgi:hypothetical protein
VEHLSFFFQDPIKGMVEGFSIQIASNLECRRVMNNGIKGAILEYFCQGCAVTNTLLNFWVRK